MIQVFKSSTGFNVLETIQPQAWAKSESVANTWVHLENPDLGELSLVSEKLNIEMDLLKAALDEEESARFDREDDVTFIIVDIPVVQPEGISFLYNTIPLGILLAGEAIVTVCLDDTTIIEDFYQGRVRGFDTAKKTRFIFQLMYRSSAKYLQYLRQIDKATTQVENALHKSMKNRELVQMLKLEKSLVFFATSLKGNEIILEKMLNSRILTKYPEDTDLLEDVIIENKQAIEMSNIYRNIISGTMTTFASIISNNLNMVMKLLASLTIIIAVPTLFASFWGMNVPVPLQGNPLGFWLILGGTLFITGLITYVLAKRDML
ncbi:MAG: magnesium transporter CorA family protein [Eubacteriales bacterium]